MKRAIAVLLFSLPVLGLQAQADDNYGSLNGFDVVNDTGVPGHGFEIEIEGIFGSDIAGTYDSGRYGSPAISEDNSGPSNPTVSIRYESGKNRDGSWSAYTAVPENPLAPEDGYLFLDPSLNVGGEHFGVDLSAAPAGVRCYWLIDDGSGNLVRGPLVNIATPAFVFFEPAAEQPAEVVAVIEPVEPEDLPDSQFGEATWVKVTGTQSHNANTLLLSELVSDNPNDPKDSNWKNGEHAEVEVEWALLQTEFGAADGGANGELVGETENFPNGNEIVTRRYDFFTYAGPVNPETGEALVKNAGADGVRSSADVVGEYIGSHMAGLDVRVGPTVVLTTTAGAFTNTLPVPVTATFSAPVTGLLSSEITVTNATVSGFAGSGAVYTFNLGAIPAGATATAKIAANTVVDGSANPNTVSNTLSVTHDIVAPSVVSSTLINANPSNFTTVNFDVDFSETVVGVGVADFSLTTTGVVGASVTGVGGSGAAYTVAVNAGTGNGTIRLNVLNDGTIDDRAGNGLTAAFSAGSTYTIDKTRPSVVLSSVDPLTGDAAVDVTATFSESVTEFVSTDITVTNATVSGFAGSGAVYTFVLDPITAGTTATALVAGGKAKDVANNTNTASNTLSVVEDVAPTVLSSALANGNPSKFTTVNFTVTFSESVVGVDLADFSLTTTGVVGAATSAIGGTGATRTVAVTTGTGNGTIRLNVLNNGTIDDLAGNSLAAAFSAGATYTIDKISPTVVLSSVDPLTGSGPIDVTATFSESVTGFVSTDITVTNATVSGFAGSGAVYTFVLDPITAGTNATALVPGVKAVDAANNNNTASNTLTVVEDVAPSVLSSTLVNTNPSNFTTVNFTVTFSESVVGVDVADFSLTTTGVTSTLINAVSGTGAVRTVAVKTGSGNGTIRLNVVNNGTIDDVGGNSLTAAFSTGATYTIDKAKPTVVLSSLDPLTGIDPIDVTVTFSESVTGFLSTDITATNASVSGFAGSGAVYTFVLDPNTAGTNATAKVNGGNAVDAANNSNSASNTLTVLEDVAPSVLSTTRINNNPSNFTTVNYTVTFSESVVGVDVADFSLTVLGPAGTFVSGVSGSGATRTVAVNTGTGNGTIRLDVLNNGTIDDLAGNSLAAAFSAGAVYTMDKTKPSVVLSSPDPLTGDAAVDVTVTFSESVTGFVSTDITVTNATVSGFAGSGAVYTFVLDPTTVGTSATANVAGSKATDSANNTNTASNTLTVSEDVVPTVVSSTLFSSSPTNDTTLKFVVTFSESVVGVGVADFALTTTGGVAGASVSSLTGSGAVYTVSIATGTGDGTIELEVLNDGTIDDLAGNSLAAAFSAGAVYTIDKTRPSVVLSSTDPLVGDAAVDVTVTFSESVTGFVSTDITVTNATVSGFAGSGAVYTFVLDPITAGTNATATVLNNKAADAAGNLNTNTVTPLTVQENVEPTVSSSTRLLANPTNDGAVTFRVIFSESVTGVDEADFSLTTSVVTGASVSGVSGSGTTYTITVLTGTGDGTIRLDTLDDDSIVDLNGNALNGGFTTGEEYTVDKTKPGVTLSSDVVTPIDAEPFLVTVTFTEVVTSFTSTDITVTNATVSSFSGSGAVYTFLLDPIAAGESTALVAINKAADTAGNTNTVSNTLTWTIPAV